MRFHSCEVLMKNVPFIIDIYLNKKGDLKILNNSLYNLENRLFDGYHSNIPPVQNPNTVVLISIDLTLLQLIHMVINILKSLRLIIKAYIV